jgi:hypothetical protein
LQVLDKLAAVGQFHSALEQTSLEARFNNHSRISTDAGPEALHRERIRPAQSATPRPGDRTLDVAMLALDRAALESQTEVIARRRNIIVRLVAPRLIISGVAVEIAERR